MKMLCRFLFILFPIGLIAQNGGVDDPPKIERKVIPYPYVREADVMWAKNVWRVIDLREKINHPLYYPTEDIPGRTPLIKVIRDGIEKGRIQKIYEYDVFTNEPGRMFTKDESLSRFVEWIERKDSVGNTMYNEDGMVQQLPDTMGYDRIAQYWIKEQWFFDKQRSVMEVRILYLAPVITVEDPEAGRFAYKPLFWLEYPDCRWHFAQYDAFNPWNDRGCMSYEGLFAKRVFNSYIRQESNVFGRPVSSYAQGMEAMLESERIKEQIYKYEEDLWHH